MSLFLIKYRMRYAIYMPPNTKDLAINQTVVAYGNRQKRNSVLVSKQLRFVAITETFNGNQVLQKASVDNNIMFKTEDRCYDLHDISAPCFYGHVIVT